ncbi:DUF192 domain-containing protein [Candidatus Woesearchaeota archaeon]|nr:DUF192 domain-containing protein [Candidatus Woesearchaeota archaeon]
MKKLVFVLISALIIIVGCAPISYVEINREKITVELAESLEEKKKGLMYREELCDSCGMLFVYEEENKLSFWMKNTLIPLDMIFINSDLEVVDVLHAEPCTADPCKHYIPRENAQYVLEANANKFDESIIGQKIRFFLE